MKQHRSMIYYQCAIKQFIAEEKNKLHAMNTIVTHGHCYVVCNLKKKSVFWDDFSKRK